MKPELYGTVTDNTHLDEIDFKCRVVIEPSTDYFNYHLINDRLKYEKLILLHGLEPPPINYIKNEILNNYQLFDHIYSYDDEIVAICNNAKSFAFGSCWVLMNEQLERIEKKSEYKDVFNIKDKKFKISFIKSGKNQLEGHKLRHIVDLSGFEGEIFIPHNHIPSKIPLFTDSMFHLCIENSRYNNYFTEKLIDCLISKTIPIYWGCPNISKYFNTEGMFIVNNIEEMNQVIKNLSVKDYYDKLNAVLENFKLCKEYAFFWDRLNEYILK
jgi:hypothetical protein